MAANMMTTPKWYEHITNVILGTTQRFNREKSSNALEYINERKGVPFAAMGHIVSDVYAAASHAYLFEHNLKNSNNMLMYTANLLYWKVWGILSRLLFSFHAIC